MTAVSELVFKKYDKDGNGISASEFKFLCYDLGHHLTDEEISVAMKVLDANGSGVIEYPEFLKWWRDSDKWGKLSLDEDQLKIMNQASTYFAYFDKANAMSKYSDSYQDKSGVINRTEFEALHKDLVKHRLTTKSLEDCLADLDSNGYWDSNNISKLTCDRDGKIGFNEYIDWLVRIGSIPVKWG